eukprot:1247805-Rhodomonas_salina.2
MVLHTSYAVPGTDTACATTRTAVPSHRSHTRSTIPPVALRSGYVLSGTDQEDPAIRYSIVPGKLPFKTAQQVEPATAYAHAVRRVRCLVLTGRLALSE